MTSFLKQIGDDLALILDREDLKSLGIGLETPLDVSFDETGIHIRSLSGDRTARVSASALRMMEIHEATLRKLAQ